MTTLAHPDGFHRSSVRIVELLKPLSRKDRVARVLDDGSAVIEVAGRSPQRAAVKSVAAAVHVAPADWQTLHDAGYVVPAEDATGAYRLANAGRLALRRHLSRGGAPESGRATPAPGKTEARATPPSKRARPQVPAPARSETGRELPGFNDKESPLFWLSRRRDRLGQPLLSVQQLRAGERLRRDFTLGAMTPCITQSWSPVAFAGGAAQGSDKELQLRDSQIRARESFRAALADVGPEFDGVLVDVCCHLKGLEEVETSRGWPPRTGKVVLKLGLDRLARHYGLV